MILDLKNIVLITDNIILKEALDDNYPNKIIYLDDKDKLSSLKKIDILITDQKIDLSSYFYKINFIFNLGDKDNFKGIKNHPKPWKLEKIIDNIINFENDKNFFDLIFENYIYTKKHSQIKSPTNDYQLTNIENEIIAKLVISENYELTYKEVLVGILGYHQDSDTNTLNTHLYRLKNKLPKGMIEFNSRYIKLLPENSSNST